MNQIWLIFDENDRQTQALRSLCLPLIPHIALLDCEHSDGDLLLTLSSLSKTLNKIKCHSIGLDDSSLRLESDDLSTVQNAIKSIKGNEIKGIPSIRLWYGEERPSGEQKQRLIYLTELEKNLSFTIVGFKVMNCTSKCARSWYSYGTVYFGSSHIFRDSLFINGNWVHSSGGKQLLVSNSAKNGEVFHSVCSGEEKDINDAVDAAEKAFPIWSKVSVENRAKYLNDIADEIEKRKDMLIDLEVLDMGKMKREVAVDIADSISTFRYYAKIILEGAMNESILDTHESKEVLIKVIKEPLGVVGLIIPWNYPFMNAAWKVAPCLAAGSTCVLKPSEFTPLTVLELGAICIKIGLPPGVLNIVNGTGQDTGAFLSNHPKIQKVSFTGSVGTGVKVMQKAAETIKTVTLELGGKSPMIIFPENCDINAAADWITTGIFFNNGQVCSATSRLIIHKDIKDQVLEEVVKLVNDIRLGDGFNENADLGPLVNKIQYDKVVDYIKLAIKEGGKLICGGVPDISKEPFSLGYFIPPTIFEVDLNHTIWNEEVFGPVLAVHTFETEEEALQLANDTSFGLAAAVMTKNEEQADRVSNALRAGVVWINCSQPVIIQAPWGGMKASGIGREMGPWGLNNYLEIKQTCKWISPENTGWNWFVRQK